MTISHEVGKELETGCQYWSHISSWTRVKTYGWKMVCLRIPLGLVVKGEICNQGDYLDLLEFDVQHSRIGQGMQVLGHHVS